MGFKEENYTPKGRRLGVFLWLIVIALKINAQSNSQCPIRVDFEPRLVEEIKSANTTKQSSFPFFKSWNNIDALRLSDDIYASVNLSAYKRSTVLSGDQLSLSIPDGAEISGIELIVEGHTSGSGFAEGEMVYLLDQNGKRVGQNQAKNALPEEKDWLNSSDSTDFIWRYGDIDDLWGLNLDKDDIKNQNFGYALQVRNKLPEAIDVLIDQISIVVHYTPLYRICTDHACIPFYIDETQDPNISYEWYIPEGWELISDSENDAAINIGPSYAQLGTYEICLEIFESEISQGICCRSFNYEDCNPGEIRGTVFLDNNGNFFNDTGDEKLANVIVNLFETDGTNVSTTTTDSEGNYSFEAFLGDYFIQVVNVEDQNTYVFPYVGPQNTDSDINGTFGVGTTDIINVKPDEIVENIDAGLSRSLSLGDFVWEDLNGDGIQGENEPGISDMLVTLDYQGGGISTLTDENGNYLFSSIPSGSYTLNFANTIELVETVTNQGTPELDNDFDGTPISISYLDGGLIDSLDAGFFQLSSLGDFIWEDLNFDGIQDENEPGISDLTLYLLADDGSTIDSTISDTDGKYFFNDLSPGVYTISVKSDPFLILTEAQQGTSTDFDSDGTLVDGIVTSSIITISSGSQVEDIDFGFYTEPVDIGGFTWYDESNDGQYQEVEKFKPGIEVSLFNEDGTLEDQTISDDGGYFEFLQKKAGNYYLQFEITSAYMFTIPNQGDELSDSDVDGSFGMGTTNLITLLPGDINMTIAAGYQLLPKVGNFVWHDLNANGIQETSEPGIDGITVSLFTAAGELVETTTTFTNTQNNKSGHYIFDTLAVGDYYIQFEKIDSLIFTTNEGSANESNSDVTGENGIGTTSTFSLVGNDCDLTIDAGYYQNASIGDFVWKDLTRNNIQDQDEPGVEGAQITLIKGLSEEIAETTSDVNGFYEFTEIKPGEYKVRVEFIERLTSVTHLSGDDSTIDSDGIPLLNGYILTSTIDITSGDNRNDIDFGFFDTPSRLGGFAWFDIDNNGQFLETEEDINEGIQVILKQADGQPVDTTFVSGEGFYVFENLMPGDYYVVFEQPAGQLFTEENLGGDNLDSDVTNSFEPGSTDQITILQGDQFFNYSAGYLNSPKVGDYVWLDANRNGIQDPSEHGINDLEITLYDETDQVVAIETTGINPATGTSGFYQFDTLDPGTYYIIFPVLDSLDFTIANTSDEALDSDANSVGDQGSTFSFTLEGNDCLTNYDAGYVRSTSKITGEVFVDANRDGIQESSDLLLQGIEVVLYNSNEDIMQTTTTAFDGSYLFSDVEDGDYYVVFDYPSRYINTIPFAMTDMFSDSDIDNSVQAQGTGLINVVGPDLINGIDGGLIDRIAMISGRIWTDNNGDGLYQTTEDPSSFQIVTLYDLDSMVVEIALTLADGTYMFPIVEEGQYYIQFEMINADLIPTTPNVGNDDTIDSDVTGTYGAFTTDTITIVYDDKIENIDGGFYEYATIGDFAFIDENENGINDSEPGLDGVFVNLIQNGEVIQTTITAQGGGVDSGYYLFEGVVPGDYQIEFIRPLFYQFIMGNVGSDDLIDSDVISTVDNIGTTETISISSGSENLSNDAGFVFSIPKESSISGIIWSDLNLDGIYTSDEPLLTMMELQLFENGSFVETKFTDENGIYLFDNLTEGFYSVRAILALDKTATSPNSGGDDTIDSDFFDNSGNIETQQFFLPNFTDFTEEDLGVVDKVSIGDFVWDDLNNNGTQESNEPGISGINILLRNAEGTISLSTTTNDDGNYEFIDLPASMYQVCAEVPENYTVGVPNQGIDQLNSDAASDGCTEFITINSGTNNDIDIALLEKISIKGLAFVDLNGNGIQNGADPGLEGVPVTLFDSNGIEIATTSTVSSGDTMGIYTFENVPVGSYYIEFEFPEGYIFSDADNGPDDLDSDITEQNGVGTTSLFDVLSGIDILDIDGGAYLPGCIGDKVWEDINMNGLQDEGEPGIEGIEVIIFRSFGVPFDTVYTNAEGTYKFSSLKQGLYFVQFMIPQNLTITLSNVGTSDLIDSDADETGKTPLISLAHGADLTSVDCGAYMSTLASLRSVVWEDLNGDGMRQPNEARIPDIRITLYTEDDEAIASTTTNSLGLYAFQQIPVGDYKVFVDLSTTTYDFTDIDMGSDDLFDNDIHANGESDIFTSAEFLSVPNVDVGLFEMGSIMSIAWDDNNANGIQDGNEKSLEGIVVSLYNESGQMVSEKISNSFEENINFNNLRPGNYYMQYKIGEDLMASISTEDLELDFNNDAFKVDGLIKTPVFMVKSASEVIHIDAGFHQMTAVNQATHIQLTNNETSATKTDVEEETDLEIEIYPNPATQYVRIKTSRSENASITIMNAEKKIVLQTSAVNAEKIDIRNLHPGVYYVVLKQGQKKSTKKFIKVH